MITRFFHHTITYTHTQSRMHTIIHIQSHTRTHLFVIPMHLIPTLTIVKVPSTIVSLKV